MALSSFTYTQSTPADTWTINHALGVYPVIDVMVNINGTLTKIIPYNIQVVDLNNVVITFTTPYSGQARLI